MLMLNRNSETTMLGLVVLPVMPELGKLRYGQSGVKGQPSQKRKLPRNRVVFLLKKEEKRGEKRGEEKPSYAQLKTRGFD